MAIQVLSASLANKIAAGEVVERPASVVKELIENSIDANSEKITIHLKEAGISEIRVIDDGDGMSEEDSEKAFLRHATSKITYDDDLFHIKSLGFRGEALASIASVSKLTMKTSKGDKASTIINLEAGKLLNKGKGDARKGTDITVSQLFYNTPARLKYMKSIHTELGHITDLINRYALAHPSIRFEVTHDGSVIFTTNGNGNLLQVIRQIYGLKVAKNMVDVSKTTNHFHVEGIIAKPEMTRANRNFMTIIVNGRYVKSIALNYAIIRSYHTLLPRHRFPIVVLNITLDSILIDVNVHPTKLEVRFSKEKELVEVIESMIADKLKQLTLIPEIPMKREKKEKLEQREFSFSHDRREDLNHQQQVRDDNVNQTEQAAQNETFFVKEQSLDNENTESIDKKAEREPLNSFEQSIVSEDNQGDKQTRIPDIYPIGQYRGTYILGQNHLGFYMIDQHAAQERIKYEFYKKSFGKPDQEIQQLLFPLTFEFTNQEILNIEKYLEQLNSVGLYLESFGNNTYAVRSYPTWFPQGLEEEVIRDIVEQVIQTGKIEIDKIREEVAILMSCKRSIKANHYLNIDEMKTLLTDLGRTSEPFTCPHGRPVIIHYTNDEIEKMFKRIM